MIHRVLDIFKDSSKHFEGQEAGETVVMLLRRHVFTILAPISFFILLALLPLAAWYLLPPQLGLRDYAEIYWFAMSLWYLFLWLLTFYFLTIYSLNVVIVTEKRIIESEQRAFFSRKVSELHVNRIQDVSAHTHGFLETIIGYGDISVQTAASEREFVFHKIGRPERVKDSIMKIVAQEQSKEHFI